MTRKIPEHIIEEIRANLDVVSVIKDYVSLQRRGRNHVGLCPFHSEDTPSFTVSQEKQMWHCFGCGEGGNIYTFLMKHQNITFPEAVERLADAANVSLPQQEEATPAEMKLYNLRQKAYEANRAAAQWFFANLRNSPEAEAARQYLIKRQLSRKVQDTFGLGYAPEKWDGLLEHLVSQGFTAEELFQVGLVSANKDNSRYFDRFRGRIIFPIIDVQGRVVAFGGRIIADGEPKYLNSPETPVFHKGKMLYGLNWAAKSIRAHDRVIVMEGYMDVIAAHQFDVTNAVASLGTAFTPEQGKQLQRFTNNVSIAYDSDTAGAKATLRGLNILHSLGAKVKVGQLPQGLDPDDFLRRKGKEAFGLLITKHAQSLVEYKLNLAAKQHDPAVIEGRVAIVNAILPDLARLNSAVEREEYIRLVAKRLQLSEEAVRAELRIFERNSEKTRVKKDKIGKNRHDDNLVQQNTGTTTRNGIERQLLQHVLRQPAQLDVIAAVMPLDIMVDKGVKEVFLTISGEDYIGGWEPGALMDKLTEAGQKVLSQAIVNDENRLDKFEHLLEKLYLFQVDRHLEELEHNLAKLQNEGSFADIQSFLIDSFGLWQENDFLRRTNIKRH